MLSPQARPTPGVMETEGKRKRGAKDPHTLGERGMASGRDGEREGKREGERFWSDTLTDNGIRKNTAAHVRTLLRRA